MAGLKIKHYAKSGVIRSVGDSPNGIVAISFFGGAHFVIHPKAEPVTSEAQITVAYMHGSDPEENGAVPITAEEAIEAAVHCKRTPWVLWNSAVIAIQNEANRLARSFDADAMIATAEFVRDVRDQLAVAGLISKADKSEGGGVDA
jgi:hypothetical protein